MILNAAGNKRTANQLAKELVFEYGQNVTLCWQDRIPYAHHQYTPREEEQVRLAIEVQLERVNKLLNYPDKYAKRTT